MLKQWTAQLRRNLSRSGTQSAEIVSETETHEFSLRINKFDKHNFGFDFESSSLVTGLGERSVYSNLDRATIDYIRVALNQLTKD